MMLNETVLKLMEYKCEKKCITLEDLKNVEHFTSEKTYKHNALRFWVMM